MEPPDIIDHCNALLSRIEKLWKLALSILAFVLGGTLWGARLEWRVNETTENLTTVTNLAQKTALDVSHIKGHLNLTTSVVTKTPAPTN